MSRTLTSDSAAQAPIDKVQRFRSIKTRLRLESADARAVAALLAIVTAFAIARLWVQPGLGDWDIMTFYLPWFSFLGEQLRHGNIPGWNPHIFSGMPFAGDTQSGWWYAPAMVLFTILPPLFAYKIFIWFHLLLCALAAFVLARLLGLKSFGAFAAGLAYFCLTVGAAFTFQIQMEMAPWLAVALIGVELAARQQQWDRRIAACFLSAFAFSQILGGYLGQGAYYAGLFIGAYIVWRLGLIPPGGRLAEWRRRVMITFSAGTITFVVGVLIAAAGLLPRFDAVDRAYVGSAAYRSQDFAPDQGADTWFIAGRLFQLRMQKFDYYYGGAIITIAVLGLIFLPRFRHLLFFALAAYAALELPLRPRNIHELFYHLPEFRSSHLHDPTRVLSILPLCVALFAGLAFDQIKLLARPRYAAAGAAMVGLVWWRILRADHVRDDWFLEDITKLSALILGLTVLAYVLSHLLKRHPQAVMRIQTATVGVALLAVFIDPAGFVLTKPVAGAADQDNLANAVSNSASASDPGGAGEFLQAALDDSSEPFRYAGYAAPDGLYWEMHEGFAEPWIQALLGNNRAMRLGLYDIQGYNPSQVVRYQAAISAMNGFEREYHEALIYASGLGSPILDLLNVRYLIVPSDLSAVTGGRVANTPYPPQYVEIWKNETVTILENRHVLPRAWIVHSAIELDPTSALQQINAGTIDPATTATVEQSPPVMSAVPAGDADAVAVTHYSPDRVELEATAASDGLLVLSDVYDPGWTVKVDGKRAELYVVDGVVRGVALPAGPHTVTFDYAPSELRYGLIVSLATIAGMLIFLGYIYRGATRA